MSEEKYLKLLEKRWSIYSDVFGMKNFEKRMNRRISREGGKKILGELETITPVLNKKILDAGSCCGEFLFEAVDKGAIGYGIEPDDLSLEISELLFASKNKEVVLKKAGAENIPFPNDSFDIVVSIFIIEHIKDYQTAILEMVRVLKPGGILWLKSPNYLHYYERHYKRYYFPFLPKFIEQKYFNLISGKKSNYFINLNRVTPGKLFRFLKKNNLKFSDLSKKDFKNKSLWRGILHGMGIYPQINLVIYK